MQLKANSGYIYAFGAALALSASFVFSKSALNTVNMVQFGFTWFTLGVIWNVAWYIFHKSYRNFRVDRRRRLQVAISIAILEAAATMLFYFAIQAMENPAVVSFIGNLGPVFVAILGVTLLKERFGKLQVIGITVTLLGVFVINYKGNAFGGFLEPGAAYVILASVLFAVATIVGRRFKASLDPDLMSLTRSVILALVFSVLFLQSDHSLNISLSVWKDLAIGSVFETLITIVFAYQALKRIEATSTSLIISSKGVWTLVLAWIFLGIFPTGLQLAGGLLTLAGVYLITVGSSARRPG